MSIQSEDVRNRVYLRLDQYGLATNTTDSLLDMYIEGVATELAAKNLDILLRTDYFTTDSNGKFTIPGEIVPYLVLCNGTEGERHSWQRLTPIEYMYFINWDSRVGGGYAGSRGGGLLASGNRYTIIPTPGEEGTTLQVLEIRDAIPIMCIYYPITPPISDFPDYALDLISNMVLERYIMDRQDQVKDRSVKLLMDKTVKLEKTFVKQAGVIEATYVQPTIRNNKTKNWIYSESNDYGYWRR
jgi:hypothetical protein